MPYEVIGESPAVDVLKALDPMVNDEGKQFGYYHETRTYTPGDIIEDEDVSPVIAKLYDDRDEHTRSVLRKLARPTRIKEEE